MIVRVLVRLGDLFVRQVRVARSRVTHVEQCQAPHRHASEHGKITVVLDARHVSLAACVAEGLSLALLEASPEASPETAPEATP